MQRSKKMMFEFLVKQNMFYTVIYTRNTNYF